MSITRAGNDRSHHILRIEDSDEYSLHLPNHEETYVHNMIIDDVNHVWDQIVEAPH